MSEPQFSLSDYLSTVQEVIQITFNEPVWVKAEIRNLNIKGGGVGGRGRMKVPTKL
jgi:exodeoxyribonuclease VII large subunit